MHPIIAKAIGGWEILLMLAIVILLLASKAFPELAKGLGQGIKEFKKATREVTEEMHRAMGQDINHGNGEEIERFGKDTLFWLGVIVLGFLLLLLALRVFGRL